MKQRARHRRRRERNRRSEPAREKGWTVKLHNDGWFQQGWSASAPRDMTRFSAAFQCINLISDDIAKLAIHHLSIEDNGTKTRINDSPIVRLLNRPNSYQTRADLIKAISVHHLVEGNGYMYGLPSADGGLPETLHAITPYRVVPHVAIDGAVFYDTSFIELELPGIGRTTTFRVPARDMFHHRTLTFRHALRGISPLHAAAASCGTGHTILDRQELFFRRGARPAGVLKTPQTLSKAAIARLKEQTGGSDMAEDQTGRTLILEEGLEFQAMSMTAEHAQLIETLNFSVEDVARAFKVPVFMLGNLQGVTYSSGEQLRAIYYGNCLQWHIEALEVRLHQFFRLPENEVLEFDLDQLLRAETQVRLDAIGKGVQHGVFTPNEARRREGLPPVEGGENAFMQQQMRPLDQLAAPQAAQPQPPSQTSIDVQAHAYEQQLRAAMMQGPLH